MAFQYNHYYEIYNSSSGKYVNLNGDHENNVVNNGEKVTVYARTNNPDQRWALERYGSDNQVRIVLQRGGGWYALNYNTENTNCIVWHLNSAADKDKVVAINGDGSHLHFEVKMGTYFNNSTVQELYHSGIWVNPLNYITH